MSSKQKWVRWIKRIFLGIFFLLIGLFLCIWLLLKNDTVQTFAVKQVTNQIEKNLGIKASIRRVSIEPIKFIALEGVKIFDHHQNLMIGAKKLKLDITSYNLAESKFNLDEIVLESPVVNMVNYEGEKDWNLVQWINTMPKSDSNEKSVYNIRVDELRLDDLKFSLSNQNVPKNDSLIIDHNHLTFYKSKVRIKNIHLKPDDVKAELKELSGALNQKIKNIKVATNYANKGVIHKFSKISFTTEDMKMDSKGEITMDLSQRDIEQMIKIGLSSLNLNVSTVLLSKITPEYKNWKESISISTNVNGNLNALTLKQLNVKSDNGVQLFGDFELSNVLDSITPSFVVGLPKLNFNHQTLKYYAGIFDLAISNEIYDYTSKLGSISIKAFLEGDPNRFSYSYGLNSFIGRMESSGTLDKKGEQFHINGFIDQFDFKIGALLSNKDLNQIKLSGKYDLNVAQQLNASTEFKLEKLDFKGYGYHNIQVKGDLVDSKLKANLRIDEANLKMKQTLELDLNQPFDIALKGNVERFKASKLKLLDRAEDLDISFKINIDTKGDDLNDLGGKVHITNFKWLEGFYHYEMGDFEFISSPKGLLKSYSVKSDWLDFKMQGSFQVEDLSTLSSTILAEHFSTYFPELKKQEVNENVNCQIDLNYHYILPLNRLFFPDIKVDRLTMKGRIDGKQKNVIDIHTNVYGLERDNLVFQDLTIGLVGSESNLDLILKSSKIDFTDSLNLKNFKFVALNKNNKTSFNISWLNNDTLLSSANVGINTDYNIKDSLKISFAKNSKVWLDSLKWTFNSTSPIVITKDKYYVPKVDISNGKQGFVLQGVVGPEDKDKIDMSFNNVDLITLLPLYQASGFDLMGVLNGKVELAAATGKVRSEANFNIQKFKVNNVIMGEFEFVSKYNPSTKRIEVDSYIGKKNGNHLIDFNADYFPFEQNDQFHGNLVVNRFPIRVLNKMLDGAASFGGGLSGELTFYGSAHDPRFRGKLSANGARVNVAYLGKQSYTVKEDEITVSEKEIVFRDFGLHDVNLQRAKVNGKITHDLFSDITFDLKILMDKFLVLNTTRADNESFYGTALSSGSVEISGNTSMMMFNVKAKTDKLVSTVQEKKEYVTVINIPLDAKSEATQSDFITFIKKNKKPTDLTDEFVASTSMGMMMNFEFDVNETAEINLIFDSKVGDAIRARGKSKLRVFINDYGDMSIYGDYTITEGDYLFTLQNFINKKFILKPGGTVKWIGDPYTAVVDIETYYQTTTNISEFVSNSSNQKVKANCLLSMKGDMMGPEIAMNIEFPEASETVKSELNKSLDTEKKVIDQFFNLMIFNRMIADNSSKNVVGEGISKSTGEMIEAQLDYWLSQFSEKVKLGFNSESLGDALGSEYNVEFEKKINDKLNVSGNVGWATNGDETGEGNKHLAGDVALKYTLTDEVDLTVFDRGNEMDMTKEAARTQGVGVKYETSFDNWNELKEPIENFKEFIRKVKILKGNYTR